MYNYIKALHVIFVVTWFSGMFYIVRLFIYNTEAGEKNESVRDVLRGQFRVMIRRLWLGITWPSAILTVIFGGWMWIMLGATPAWLLIKVIFVFLLLLYHFSLQHIYNQQMRNVFQYSSGSLRIWNELATLFLVAIVMLAIVKKSMSWVNGIIGLAIIALLLFTAIKIYKRLR
jgi:protoporphyrinogen IX oxidase